MSLVTGKTRTAETRRLSRRQWVGLGLIAILIGLGVSGSDRTPADATQPLEVVGEAEFSQITGRRFRIGSFNIQRGKGRDGKRDLQRTIETIRRAKLDVVGLFEVAGYFSGRNRHQAAELGRDLNMAAVFAPTERRFWHNHFGNGLLSRVRLGTVLRVPLPCTQGRKFRSAMLTRFVVDGRKVNFLAVHIDRVKDRQSQLREVFALFHSLKSPAVLVGDLNIRKNDPLFRKLIQPDDSDPAESCRPVSPASGVDWIISRGLTVVTHGFVDDGASDHPLIWVEFELPKMPATASLTTR